MIAEQRKYRVFFIEDEPGIVELYQNAFYGKGFEVKSVMNGKDALDIITDFREGKEEKPDIIVSDILLPDVSGLEILKEIRKNREFDSTPIIMLTNYGTKDIKETIEKTPNTEHVLKMDTSPLTFAAHVREVIQTID